MLYLIRRFKNPNMLSVKLRPFAFRPLVFVLWSSTAWMMVPSCSKEEGPGGTGSISGTIIENFYDESFARVIYQKPAVDEEVFILYGQDNTLGDRVFTGITGEFRFKYLYPGRYYIYFSSGDPENLVNVDSEKAMMVDLERGEDLDLGNLEKISTLDFDDGSAVIKGVVKVIDYVNTSQWPNLVIKDISYAMEQEVYLSYDHQDFYKERIRTQYNGYFEFGHLIPGEYLVFLYSDDVTGETDRVVLKYEVTISEFDQVVDLGEITIEKR